MGKTSVMRQIIDVLKSFTGPIIEDERGMREEDLNPEEKELLKELRERDKVSSVESSMSKKYGVTVDTAEAKNKARAQSKTNEQVKKEEKNIEVK